MTETAFDIERFGLVTGSKCSVLFPLKGDGKVGQRTYAKQLANEMFFNYYDEVGSWETEHGKFAEEFAFQYYMDHINRDVKKGSWFKNGECGGTTDALAYDRVIDFKCPTTLKGWLDYIHEPLKKEQRDQLQMYMYLTGKPHAEIAAFLLETDFMSNQGKQYPVPLDKRMIIVQVDKDPGWEKELNVVLPGVIKMRDEFIEQLKTKFPR